MKDKKSWLLSFDAGTGGGRCFLVNAVSGEFFSSHREWSYQVPKDAPPGGVEFHPQEFWNILGSLCRETLDKANIHPSAIYGVSSTSQREGMVFLDRAGKEVYAGPNLDLRTTREIDKFIEEQAYKIYMSSGHWPIPMFAPYRLLWFKREKPEIYQDIGTVLLINDWILYRLSGEKASEPSNAVETLLFDIRGRNWNLELIAELGLRTDIFPTVVPSGQKIGEVTPEAAEITGLEPGTPVVTGGADAQCALIGLGVTMPGEIGAVLGSFAPIMMITQEPLIPLQGAETWSGLPLTPQYGILESTAMSAGQSLRFLRDFLFGAEKLIIEKILQQPLTSFQYMDQLAQEAEVGAGGISSFIGADIPDYKRLGFSDVLSFVLPQSQVGKVSKGDLVRATYESISFAIRGNIERLEQIIRSGTSSEIRAAGGCTKSAILPQILADVTGYTVKIPVCKEASSLGAAIAAGVGSGAFKDFQEGARTLVKWENSYVARNKQQKLYECLYRSWLQQRDIIHELKEVHYESRCARSHWPDRTS